MIKLITHTPNPEELLTSAYSECYQKPVNVQTVTKHLKHSSVLEHVSFTFKVKMSRVAWEQMVRHRIASFTAQSHRYTPIKEEDCYYYIPVDVDNLPEELREEWIDDCKQSFATYQKWVDRGIKKEDARYLINKGVSINATVTMNLRSIINFLTLRTDSHAQGEIRELANEMERIVFNTMPNIKDALIQLIVDNQN